VILFEGTLRRTHTGSTAGANGTVSPPRASFDWLHWIFFPRQTLEALKMPVLDRGLTAGQAQMLAEKAIAPMEAERQPKRRQLQRSYAYLLADGEVIEVDAVRTDQDGEVRTVSSSVTAAVREAVRCRR
jgi:hypothetical protein